MFNSVTGSVAGRSRRRTKRLSARTQVLRMQAQLLADATSANVPPHTRALCAKAWDTLQERLRIIDGKPLPGHLKPELEQRRKRRTRVALSAISPTDLPNALTQSEQSA